MSLKQLVWSRLHVCGSSTSQWRVLHANVSNFFANKKNLPRLLSSDIVPRVTSHFYIGILHTLGILTISRGPEKRRKSDAKLARTIFAVDQLFRLFAWTIFDRTSTYFWRFMNKLEESTNFSCFFMQVPQVSFEYRSLNFLENVRCWSEQSLHMFFLASPESSNDPGAP